eukprot:CCRYP_008385-RA/>CCRYP_008385-RA protein AED:0.18 eAED:0.13 QI:0/0/0/1/0.4/0.16/6/0/1406
MCFSCGFDVEGWHTSATCRNKKQGGTRTVAFGRTPRHTKTPAIRLTNNCDFISSTPNKHYTNYYAALQTTLSKDTDDDNEATVIASNVSCQHKSDQLTATTTASSNGDPSVAPTNICLQAIPCTVTQPATTRHLHYAIFDSGATAHFLVDSAHVVNRHPALKPLTIRLPNGKHIVSTHTCNLDLPWLPHSITEAHIVPGLSHSSLISTRKFCYAGCHVTLDQHACRIYYQGALVLTGTRDETTGLWKVPIHPHRPAHPGQQSKLDSPHESPLITAPHTAMNMYTLPSKQQQLKYMHQAFFSPPIATLLKAINNNQLQGFPLMKADLVRKYLAPSPATSKGHMKRPRTGIRSTRPTLTGPNTTPVAPPSNVPDDTPPNEPMTAPHFIPPDITDTACNVYCFAALADKHHGTMYTDATGALPAVTLEGNQYYLSKGYKPTFNVTDNQATTPIKAYLGTENCKWQFIEPNNHRINAAERAIQTFKNHFISGLCSTDSNWPLQIWDTMTEQAIITLNLLRTSRIDPSKSAYHQLHGHRYNWNAYPLAPPGTKAVIYELPTTRTSWGTRGLDAWYCGPAFDHYRNMKFYVPSTKAYRVSGSYDLFPQHCILPTFTPAQHTNEVHRELFESLQTLDKPTKRKFLKKITRALDILNTRPEQRVATEGDTTEHPANALPIQRVVEHPTVTTSTNPTDPKQLHATPRTHQRATRHNIPNSLPTIINPVNEHTPRRSMRLAPDDAPILPVYTVPSSARLPMHSANIIAFQAVDHITNNVYNDSNAGWHPCAFLTSSPSDLAVRADADIDHMCAGVVHPTTGETITSYKKLIACPLLRDVWTTAFGKEFGNLAQGDRKTGEKGTNTMFVMRHAQIRDIPRDRTITYGRVMVDYIPIDYPGKLTTRTADLTTSKILWNSVLSTKGAKFMGLDLKSFCLTAMLDRPEYMKMPLALFPNHIRAQYNLDKHAVNGFVYLELHGAIYGLPQAGALANKLLQKRLAPHGYYEVAHTPGLWRHVTRPISFTLVVDDFGVKYVGQEHAEHLIHVLQENCTMSIDWNGALYCGIQLDWDYDHRTLDISMARYIDKVLQRFQHPVPSSPQNGPYKPYPKKYGAAAQDPIPTDASAPLDSDGQKCIQQIVGALLYYARAVDNTILLSMSAIASEQAHPTQLTQKRCQQLLDYCASHPDAVVRFQASNMVLNIHSDASYLSESNAAVGLRAIFSSAVSPLTKHRLPLTVPYTSSVLQPQKPNWGPSFSTAKKELGHTQPTTPTHCDNETATSIANNTVKKQRSRSMEMRFFWVTDQVNQHHFHVRWHPGQENLADYFTKHFDTRHHISVRPWYLHTKDSPQFLPRAAAPSSLRGCVGTLPNGYMRTSPLPRIPLTGLGRVPLDRQHMGLPNIQPITAAPFCVHAAILSH